MNRVSVFSSVLFLICICSITANAFQADEIQRKYNTIYVDINNQIWFGAESGLLKWHNGKCEKIDIGIDCNITSLHSFYQYLLIGTKKGDVYSYSVEQKKLRKLISQDKEISAFATKADKIYVATKGNGFLELGSTEVNRYTSTNGLRDDFLYDLQIHHNQVWCSSDNGISIFDSTMHSLNFEGNSNLPDNLVTSFEFANEGVYIGMQQGDLVKVLNDNKQEVVADAGIWNHGQINDLLLLDHSLVIATTQGAFLLNEKGQLLKTLEDSSSVLKLSLDKEANLWWCNAQKESSTYGEQIRLIQSFRNIPLINIHSLLIDKPNSYWFTPDQGLFHFYSNSNFSQKVFLSNASLLIDITSIYLNKDGYLWVGTSGKGLFRVDTSSMKVERIQIDESEETSTILSVNGDDSTIWIASLNGVWFCKWRQAPLKFYSVEDHFNTKKYYVYQVKKDRSNNLWMATDGYGMIRIQKDSIDFFTRSRKFSTNVFYSVEEDGMGQIWFNASNDGLYCYTQDGSIFHLNDVNGLLDNDVLSVSSYRKEYLIAVTRKGIDLIHVQSKSVSHYYFDHEYKDILPEMNSISFDGFQTLYIGTNRGLIQFYLPTGKTNFLPRIQIDEIAVMGNAISKTQHTFGYNENYFRFHIEAIQNSNSPIYYRYKLVGLSDEWNKTYDQNIVFPRLNAGEYQMKVQVANNQEFLNASEATFAFEIAKPIWKTWWFLSLLFASLIAILYGYVRHREKRLSRMQQLENANVIAEFESLKQQVSPHFLFNSFNTLMLVIDNDTKEKALEYTQKLSDFYRSLISYRDSDLVLLNEELELLLNYIYLQKMRFGQNLSLHILIDHDKQNKIEIPPLTLQLLAENAIKHNTVSSAYPLVIEIMLEGEYIVVKNKLNKKRGVEEGERLGLQNITNRYKLFSNLPVKVNKSTTHFEVSLPILKFTL